MMIYKVAAVLVVVIGGAVCSPIASPSDLAGYSYPEPAHEEYKHKAGVYDFAYAVKDEYTGNDFGHNEVSDGSGVVTGKYFVLLPDGRIQTVTYTADHENGYTAEISYSGEPQYPANTYEAPAPAYKAPEPAYKAPAPTYEAPAPAYKAPEPTYEAPAPAYKAPEPAYVAPAPAYKAPEPVYSAPEPTYEAPEPVYSAPEPTYEAPDTLYGAPDAEYGAREPVSSYMVPASEYNMPEPMDSYRVPPAYGAKLS